MGSPGGSPSPGGRDARIRLTPRGLRRIPVGKKRAIRRGDGDRCHYILRDGAPNEVLEGTILAPQNFLRETEDPARIDRAKSFIKTILFRHDARRDLAMVLVELGHADEAKDLLLDVLKTNPRDVASLVILGNHYAKAEGDKVSAEQFFRRYSFSLRIA